MKTDTIFYSLFQAFPSIFFELINQSPAEAATYEKLIETIIVYKLPKKSREEIEAMLGLSELKQTKVYQEALEEGKQLAKMEAIPRMIQSGLSLEMITQLLDLPLEVVQQVAQQSNEQ